MTPDTAALRGRPAPRHNHVTRDVKPIGECPGCDTRPRLLAEVERLRAERAESEARVREALISLATVTDDEYATVVARHVESLLTLDPQTSGGEVQPEACPTVSGASPSEPDDPHCACSRYLVAVAVERDGARASRSALVADLRALHKPETDDPSWCDECCALMPCATLALLDHHAPEEGR